MPFFTETEDAFLRENYKTMSTAAIGAKLGRSRNSIIGRACNALGLSKKQPPAAYKPRKPQPKRITETEPKLPRAKPHVEISVPHSETNCTLAELTEKTCRWPLGEPLAKDFCYCGSTDGTDNPSQPYCLHHTQISINTTQRRS